MRGVLAEECLERNTYADSDQSSYSSSSNDDPVLVELMLIGFGRRAERKFQARCLVLAIDMLDTSAAPSAGRGSSPTCKRDLSGEFVEQGGSILTTDRWKSV